MDNRPIGFFDSGVGGLTCIPALLQTLPNERVVYFGDTARTPYGSKAIDTIKRFSFQIADYLVSHDVKMIVIACNTISATCLDALRRRHPDIPIIGVIEPIANKIVEDYKDTGAIVGVIGTKVTVASGVYANIITSKSRDIKIYSKACPLFVPMIEEGIVNNDIMDLTIKYYLDDFVRDNQLEHIVLGCTHFPFIGENIKRLYPHLQLLNPSSQVIDSVKKILTDNDMLADENNQLEHQCYASDLSENFETMINLVFEDKQGVKINFKKFED